MMAAAMPTDNRGHVDRNKSTMASKPAECSGEKAAEHGNRGWMIRFLKISESSGQFLNYHSTIYSLRSASAGSTRAARNVCVLTVTSAMRSATAPAATSVPIPMSMR